MAEMEVLKLPVSLTQLNLLIRGAKELPPTQWIIIIIIIVIFVETVLPDIRK